MSSLSFDNTRRENLAAPVDLLHCGAGEGASNAEHLPILDGDITDGAGWFTSSIDHECAADDKVGCFALCGRWPTC